jgi:peptide subunit release factor 1 (eRF1)
MSDALQRSHVVEVEGYCDSDSDCAVREVRVRIKDHDRTALAAVTASFRCPVCGGPLKLHQVRTLAEETARQYRTARILVNVQMFEREIGGDVVPATVYLDDRLPPTPAEWFSLKQ